MQGVRVRASTVVAAALLAAPACKPTPPPAPDGAQVFASVCARCHGETGTGGPALGDGGPAPRDFTDEAFQARVSDADIRATITFGRGAGMPAFGKAFDDKQLDQLVARVRAFSKARAASGDGNRNKGGR